MKRAENNLRKAATGTRHKEGKFLLGPDRNDDLRYCRPYFLIPLAAPSRNRAKAGEQREDLKMVKARISGWAQERAGGDNAQAITDIFILSHGWHRNFFSGIAAYDRLASRLGMLLRTRRLDPPDRPDFVPSENKNFHPLFLNLHWHSDPGEDEWVDKGGRRRKAEFLQNAREAFQRAPVPAQPLAGEKNAARQMMRASPIPPGPGQESPCPEPAQFVADFEALFELFSEMSAPGKDALSDEKLNERVPCLTERLDRYVLENDGNAPFQDKVSVAWTCYHEAQAQGVLLDQDEKPARSLSIAQAFTHLISFLVKVLGLATVIGLLMTPFARALGQTLLRHPRAQWIALHPPVSWLVAVSDALFTPPLWDALWRLGGIAFVLLSGAAVMQQFRGKDAPAKGLPILAVASWAYLQVWALIPIVTLLLITYPFGFLLGFFDRILGPFRIYRERVGERNSPTPTPDWDIRPWLADLARLPLVGLRYALARDSPTLALAETIDSQLAFYMMQRRGVQAGPLAADFLADLLDETPTLQNARLHFLGHSFGGLVVVNAARHLAFGFRKRSAPRRIHSLCLLEGAVASNWFEGETVLCERVDILASIFSRYDTANGYIYPIGNQGKPAAGYVGLFGVPGRKQKDEHEPQGGYATLVRPPDFGPNLFPVPGVPRVLNVDASRLIYAGPPAAGGGHDDIFKDDVLYLTWAVALLPSPQSGPPLGTVRYAGPRSTLPEAQPPPEPNARAQAGQKQQAGPK